jgi:hypothetical protein
LLLIKATYALSIQYVNELRLSSFLVEIKGVEPYSASPNPGFHFSIFSELSLPLKAAANVQAFLKQARKKFYFFQHP